MSDSTEVNEFCVEIDNTLRTLFKGNQNGGFCQYGKEGYVLPANYKNHADALRSMQVRSNDTWVITYPRSGTTWTQELVWLLENNFNFKKALDIPLDERYIFIELFTITHELNKTLEQQGNICESPVKIDIEPDYKRAEKISSPRFFKTHLPLSLLPPTLLDTAKAIYVARDPRDVVVSFYHHNRLFKDHDYTGDFKTYWNLFVNDLILWTPYFLHVKESWMQRNHPNMLFIFYEEIKHNISGVIRRIAAFLNKEPSEDQIRRLCDYVEIKNFKNNKSVHPEWMKNSEFVNPGAESFVRNGNSGEWKEYFDEEMTEQAERWIQHNLANNDLRFPTIPFSK